MEPKVPFENQYLFGNTFLEALPHPNNWIGDLFNFITLACHYMGGVPFFIVVLPILYFFYNRRFAVLVAIALFSTGIVNGLLKYLFASPRPSGLSEQFIAISSHVKEYSFGLPSGHAHVSILIWGLFLAEFKQTWIRVVSLFFIIFGPISRMYAGVHYPADVLLGFFCGLLTLWILLKYRTKVENFPKPTEWVNPNQKIRSLSLLVITISLLPTLLELSPGNTNAHLQSLAQVLTASASAGGFIIGLMLLLYNFPNLALRVERQSWGIAIVLLIFGLGTLYVGTGILGKSYFDDTSLFRYIRYFSLNLVLVFVIPYILEKKRISDQNA
jgi:membrane-associated phospholipid phosphatase